MGGIAEINNGVIKNCFSYDCNFINGNPTQNAPIVAKGNAPENCYYYTKSSVNKSYGTEKSMEQFKSGEITELINNGEIAF